ncbi:MAG: carboxypeptidase-like regulatory domain-containing protein [Candidatus Acidiferrales bacterium]
MSFALSSESALADIVHFRVTDPTGAPFPNALVILKALYDGHEVSRALTDKEGKVAEAILPRGLYRVIAAYPYALWKTDVREFLTGENPVEITLTLQALGTQDNVAFVGAPSLLIEVLERDGKPVSGATVIARDVSAKHEEGYETDAAGEASVNLISDPTVLVIVKRPNLVTRVVYPRRSPNVPKLVIRLP